MVPKIWKRILTSHVQHNSPNNTLICSRAYTHNLCDNLHSLSTGLYKISCLQKTSNSDSDGRNRRGDMQKYKRREIHLEFLFFLPIPVQFSSLCVCFLGSNSSVSVKLFFFSYPTLVYRSNVSLPYSIYTR